MLARVPAGRLGQVDDVVGLPCATCCRTPPAYVTGQVLTVDGGLQA
jgi:NAD(P)-dependent dehydrogenase (short-subunit alcohol dehydrogenase family)